MARRHKPRRGVVLLIILTLLTLLIVVGLTFAVLLGHFRRAAESVAEQGDVTAIPIRNCWTAPCISSCATPRCELSRA